MWIEILLLARLARGPMHGYELRREVEASTGQVLSNNSLYPTLRRFVEAGAVTRSVEEQDAKPPRHVYVITDVGRELMHDMLVDFPDDLALNDSEFLARLGNFGWLRPDEQVRVLDVRHRCLAVELDRLSELMAAQADPWSRMVLDKLRRRCAAERRWLAEVGTVIERGTAKPSAH